MSLSFFFFFFRHQKSTTTQHGQNTESFTETKAPVSKQQTQHGHLTVIVFTHFQCQGSPTCGMGPTINRQLLVLYCWKKNAFEEVGVSRRINMTKTVIIKDNFANIWRKQYYLKSINGINWREIIKTIDIKVDWSYF